MSVKRYQPVAQCVEPSYQAQMVEPKMMEFSEGEYVLHSDYARLKAEVERLRASSFVTAVPVEQYERVIKAGDAMAEEIIGCYRAEGYDPADSETLPKWNAAKEGKQP